MGRHSVFRGKENGVRVQGIITKAGGARFEKHRKALEKTFLEVMGRKPTTVSDADVIEYLARGIAGTLDYLRELKKSEKA